MRTPRAGEPGFKPRGARFRVPRGTWFKDGSGMFGVPSTAGYRAAGRVMAVPIRAEARAFNDGASLVLSLLALMRRAGRRVFGGGR